MRGIRHVFAYRSQNGVRFRDLGVTRNVQHQRRHDVEVVQVFVRLHAELHVRVHRRERGIPERRNQEAQIFVGQRVELVLERRENALHIARDVVGQSIERDGIEEYRRFVAVDGLFIVIVDRHVERFAQTLERAVRGAVLRSGAYQRFEIEMGDKSDYLLIKNGVTEIAENTFGALQIKIKVVAVVCGVGVDSVEIEAYQHFVGRSVVPLQYHIRIADNVVMYR